MRLCRFRYRDRLFVGFFEDDHIIPLSSAAKAHTLATKANTVFPISQNLIDFLPPDGEAYEATKKLQDFVEAQRDSIPKETIVSVADVELLVPIPRPNKLFLLAGNYAKHIEEGGSTLR